MQAAQCQPSVRQYISAVVRAVNQGKIRPVQQSWAKNLRNIFLAPELHDIRTVLPHMHTKLLLAKVKGSKIVRIAFFCSGVRLCSQSIIVTGRENQNAFNVYMRVAVSA